MCIFYEIYSTSDKLIVWNSIQIYPNISSYGILWKHVHVFCVGFLVMVKVLETLDRCSNFHGCYIGTGTMTCRADSRFTPSQWEMALLCNVISYWPDASPKSALTCLPKCHGNKLGGYQQNKWIPAGHNKTQQSTTMHIIIGMCCISQCLSLQGP